jgi:hypothetical protein
MKRMVFLVCILLTFLAVAQAQKPVYYDTFAGKYLNPAKWQTSNAANQGWNPQCWNAFDCVREIQAGKLHLFVRNFGNTDSDSDIQWSESAVFFATPNAVTSITADVTVRSYSGIGCSTNDTDRTHTQVDMGGTFFNTGTGDPFDDVTGLLIIWVDTFDPSMMSVGGWWGWEDQGYWNVIKSYPIGTPLTGTIKWDKANGQFIASVKAKGEMDSSVVMPYSLPVSAPPANGTKTLDAGVHTLNCTSAQTVGTVDATYDNVIINQ